MNNIFITGRRGIRICLCLGLRYEAKIALHVKDIANQVFGDVKEVQEICESLVKEGYLLRDPSSPKSYRLALEPKQISLGNIVRICESKFHITDCTIAKTCPVNKYCFFDKRLWGALEEKIFEMLNQISLQDYLDNMYEMSHVAPIKCHLSQLSDD